MNGEKKIEIIIQVQKNKHFIIKKIFFFGILLDDKSGSTAISCLIDTERIYFLNVGDSRGILVSTEGRILLATKDHKPSRQKKISLRKEINKISFR